MKLTVLDAAPREWTAAHTPTRQHRPLQVTLAAEGTDRGSLPKRQ